MGARKKKAGTEAVRKRPKRCASGAERWERGSESPKKTKAIYRTDIIDACDMLTTNNQTKDCPLLKSKKLSIIGRSTLIEHHGRVASETNLVTESDQLILKFPVSWFPHRWCCMAP
jgi:hypothetical protein